MPHRELAILEQLPYNLRKLKDTKHIGDRSPVFANRFCNLLLGQAKLMRKLVIALPLLDRIEIRSLKILNQSKSQNCLVVNVLDDRGDFLPGELHRGA